MNPCCKIKTTKKTDNSKGGPLFKIFRGVSDRLVQVWFEFLSKSNCVLILLQPSIKRSNGGLGPSIDLTSRDRSICLAIPFDFIVKLFPASELSAACFIPSTNKKSLPFPHVHNWLLRVSRK